MLSISYKQYDEILAPAQHQPSAPEGQRRGSSDPAGGKLSPASPALCTGHTLTS